MTSNGSGSRVLRFAVTSALLGTAPLACDSAQKADVGEAKQETKAEPDEKIVNMMPIGEEPEPEEPKPEVLQPKPEDVLPEHPKEPEYVNLRQVEEPELPEPEEPPIKTNPGPEGIGASAGPPDDPQEEDRVNEGPVPEPKPKPSTNTGRVKEPPKKVNPGPVKVP